MRYLLDELHAYEHDYSGALRLVQHKDNPSLAGDRALCAPASRKELASFQTSIMAEVKDVRNALANLATKGGNTDAKIEAIEARVERMEAKFDTNFGRIEDLLRGRATVAAPPSPVHTPSSVGPPSGRPTTQSLDTPLGHPPAYPRSLGTCYRLGSSVPLLTTRLTATEHATHPQRPTTSQLPAAPVERIPIGPPQLGLSYDPTKTFITPSSPGDSSASSALDFMSSRPIVPDMPNGMPFRERWKEVVRHWRDGAPDLNLHIPLKDWPPAYLHGPNRGNQSKWNQRRHIATEFLDR